MGEAFLYMYFVGAGVSAGVATVGLLTWKILNRSGVKLPKKKRGIV